jgi:hypothetical protein
MTFRSNDVTILGDSDSSGADAFGSLRVSPPESLFSSSQIQGSGEYYFTYDFSGGGSAVYDEDLSATILSTTTASGDRVVRQSKKYIKYEPGRSQLTLMTASMDTPKANLSQRCGYYDNDDGVFFQNDGATNYIVLRSSTSGIAFERKIPQSQWNIDTADGSGVSEFDLDVTKANIYAFDLQWLGVGRVRCGLETSAGELIYVHSFDNANLFNSVYMKRANLPIRWEMINDGAVASSSEMQSICCAVFSEGGFRPLGNPGTANNGAVTITIGTAEEAIIAFRAKDQFNRSTISLEQLNITVSNSATILVRVYVSQDIVSGTFTSASEKSEFLSNPGTVPTNKILIDSFYVSSASRVANTAILSDLAAEADYDGTQETYLVTCESLGGNASVSCSVRWKEL